MLEEPMGVERTPEFAWQLESELSDVLQTACRVQVAENRDFSAVLWDSGVIPHTDSAHFTPAELPLRPARR